MSFEKRQPNGSMNAKKRFCNKTCSAAVGGRAGLGNKTPEEVREKIRNAQRGEKGNNWKGGLWSSQPQSERKSARYRTLRKEVMERDVWKCVLCGDGGELEVDHIKSYSKYPELRFEKTNLRTLCKPCHRDTDTFAKG